MGNTMMRGMTLWLAVLGLLGATGQSACAAEAHPLAGLQPRSIGPALSSGRVADFAIHPQQPQIQYVAMASGGLWKTDNHGITWSPLFDAQGSYALGVVSLDPRDPKTVWVGSGENNSQRSVGYGDGVYRSRDGGHSWENLGLKDSGHIGAIRFHPTDPNVVYVAALGPLWSSGGDRGLYRSSDGGASWERILYIDEDTGINDVLIHPERPDELIAVSYQRRRHVWTLINGGPGSGVHKSTDGGKTWRKISAGLPGGDLGKLGIAFAPSQPDTVYALVEADEKGRGTYASSDFGERWSKRSGYSSGGAQYYHEVIVDPLDAERLYSMDTFAQVSEDGGRNFRPLSFQYRHVDDHALWIDPRDTRHLLIGGDGGIFESWDRGSIWRHVTNLPTTQFYRATPDNSLPFYNICGGTQDNHSQCGPSRTTYTDGITNADWWIAQFGDGFKPQFDPEQPELVYAQYQHGGLVRFDRRSGERTSIVPQPGSGELAYNFNWNSPLIVSPHSPTRLYFGAERLFRSDDRGDSWRAVSPDLSRDIDRNKLEVMGRVWSVDAIAKNASTSIYGGLVALAESPRVEGLLYAGTDDGLLQISADGGEQWQAVEKFANVPTMSYIADIAASAHADGVVYLVVDNHKRGDYKPYVLRSADRGRSWKLITSGLPARGQAHTIVEDPGQAGLLFVGTEFGAFFSQDDGASWHPLQGLPTIAVRDLEIQAREHDLVIGSFGRGFYVLDDYRPLRSRTDSLKAAAATLFEPRESWIYKPDDRRGWGGLGDYGHRYSGENHPHGAVLSYYLRDSLETAKAQRRKREAELAGKGEDTPYPSWESLRAEDAEEAPSVILTVRNAAGEIVARVPGPTGAGFHRVSWDLRLPAPDPVNLSPPASLPPWQGPPQGPLATPGVYSVSLGQRLRGQWQELAGPVNLRLKALPDGSLVASDPAEKLSFDRASAELIRRASAQMEALGEIDGRLAQLKGAELLTPALTEDDAQSLRALLAQARAIRIELTGDAVLASRQERVPLSLANRLYGLQANWDSRAPVTGTNRQSQQVAERELAAVAARLGELQAQVRALEARFEQLGAPYTTGRGERQE
ncbi:MAG: hypothetical protein R3F15_15355 [Lysobacterales bacterium]